MNLSRKSILVLVIVALLILAGGIAVWLTRQPPPKFSGPPEKLTLATDPIEISTLIWVAEDKGYFRDSGLQVMIKESSSGFQAVNDLLADQVDMATASGFVLAARSFEEKGLRTFATISKAVLVKLVARKDHGIEQPSDLKGKKIGLVSGSAAGFFLDRFLILNGLSVKDVTLVDLKPLQQKEAIQSGTVDALMIWEPFAGEILKALGARGVSWSGQGGRDMYWLLICKPQLIEKRPETIRRFLSAMILAEDFTNSHPDEIKAILARRLKLELPYLDAVWDNYVFRTALEQPMILALEDQAKWLQLRHPDKRQAIPNFLYYVYFDGLQGIRPAAVTIIHRRDSDDRQK